MAPVPEIVFCPSCGVSHPAEVRLDASGWPVVTWTERHDPDAAELAYHRRAIADLATDGFVESTSRGHYAAAEAFLRELLGDEEGDPS